MQTCLQEKKRKYEMGFWCYRNSSLPTKINSFGFPPGPKILSKHLSPYLEWQVVEVASILAYVRPPCQHSALWKLSPKGLEQFLAHSGIYINIYGIKGKKNLLAIKLREGIPEHPTDLFHSLWGCVCVCVCVCVWLMKRLSSTSRGDDIQARQHTIIYGGNYSCCYINPT